MLVSIPSFLLRTAYIHCLQILEYELGEKRFFELVEEEMIQETGMILESSLAKYLQKIVCGGIPFL